MDEGARPCCCQFLLGRASLSVHSSRRRRGRKTTEDCGTPREDVRNHRMGCLVWSTRSMPTQWKTPTRPLPSLVLRTGLGAAGCQPSSLPSANFCPCRCEISDNRRLVRRQDLSGRAVAAAARPALRCPASWCGMSREISHVLVFLCVAHVPCGGGGRRGSGAVSGRFSHKGCEGCEGGGVVESAPERFVSCS